QVRGRRVVVGDAPLLNAGASRDPLVRRVHHLLQVSVGEPAFGHREPHAQNACGSHACASHSSGVAASAAAMRSGTARCTASAAALMALKMARRSERPWAMATT